MKDYNLANPVLGITSNRSSRKLTISDIVHHYLAHYNSSSTIGSSVTMWSEMNEIKSYYEECVKNINGHYTIKEIVRMCVKGLYIGHQRRVKQDAIANAVDNIMTGKFTDFFKNKKVSLVNGNKFHNKFVDFEELYEAVKQLIGSISGIGFVTIYDTARRIGYLLKEPIFPIAYVYLHYNKVNAAARSIFRRKFEYREPTITFACEFKCLPSICIENLLCIYAHVFIEVSDEEAAEEAGTALKFPKRNWRSRNLSDFWEEEEDRRGICLKNKAIRWPEFSKR